MAAFALCAAISLAGCSNRGDSAALAVGSKIESQFSAGAPTFDFASATPFPWQRMYVFAPYSDQSVVDRALGFHWAGFDTSLESADSFDLVVFVQDGRVSHWYEQTRGPVTLDPIAGGPYDRAHAAFRFRSDGSGGATLEPL